MSAGAKFIAARLRNPGTEPDVGLDGPDASGARRSILVVGVSRSGTSLTTSLLKACGAEGVFDHSSMRGGYNEYESWAVFNMNNRALAHFGKSFMSEKVDDCYAPMVRQGQPWPEVLVTDARKVVENLRERISPRAALLMKDPRNSWTLGLWAEALAPDVPAIVAPPGSSRVHAKPPIVHQRTAAMLHSPPSTAPLSACRFWCTARR